MRLRLYRRAGMGTPMERPHYERPNSAEFFALPSESPTYQAFVAIIRFRNDTVTRS